MMTFHFDFTDDFQKRTGVVGNLLSHWGLGIFMGSLISLEHWNKGTTFGLVIYLSGQALAVLSNKLYIRRKLNENI